MEQVTFLFDTIAKPGKILSVLIRLWLKNAKRLVSLHAAVLIYSFDRDMFWLAGSLLLQRRCSHHMVPKSITYGCMELVSFQILLFAST